MTGIGKLLRKIGGALSSAYKALFDASERTYNSLSKEQQEALKDGSGFTAIVNEKIGETPAVIRAAIKAKYPKLDEAKVEEVILGIAHHFNLVVNSASLEDVIAAIQQYLKGQTGKFWANASRAISSLAAILFAPEGTKFEVFASIIGWVYHRFIKKD